MSCNYPVNSCTEVYLIRHAEKDRTDPLNKNPHLNENGKERSLLWNEYFKNNKIDAIYSTNYNRTIETILPYPYPRELSQSFILLQISTMTHF